MLNFSCQDARPFLNDVQVFGQVLQVTSVKHVIASGLLHVAAGGFKGCAEYDTKMMYSSPLPWLHTKL